MGLDNKLSQLMDCPLPTNNTHIIISTIMYTLNTIQPVLQHIIYVSKIKFNSFTNNTV